MRKKDKSYLKKKRCEETYVMNEMAITASELWIQIQKMSLSSTGNQVTDNPSFP